MTPVLQQARVRAAAVLVLVVCAIGAAAPVRLAAQSANISLYADPAGSSCSLTDAGPGLLNVYVVVQASTGYSGVRFSAPKPACFTGAFLGDQPAPSYLSIGDSQTGISLAAGKCVSGPEHVLTMTFQIFGTTGACCTFPVLADPLTGSVQFADCNFTEHPATGRAGVINADETCPCDTAVDFPPTVPAAPSPPDGASTQPSFLTLQWTSIDPEGQPVTYDVYFGDTPDPPLAAQNLADASLAVDSLAYSTIYRWRIVARDPANHETEGPTWTFTTRAPSQPPLAPFAPQPADSATGVSRDLTLAWDAEDPDFDELHYDVYFGTDPDPPLLDAGVTTLVYYDLPRLALATRYYWRIVARDTENLTTSSPVWTFETILVNPPPLVPFNPAPADSATSVNLVGLVLHWQSGDPEGDPLRYDVHFGTAADPPLVASNTASTSYTPASLQAFTVYHWRIVARERDGLTTSGPVWRFRTTTNQPPSAPTNPIPTNGATISPVNVTLRWSPSTDPEGLTVIYWTALGTSPNPPLNNWGSSTNSLNVGNLSAGTQYYWRVEARDAHGGVTSSAQWTFTTAVDPLAPEVPHNPIPQDSATGVSRTQTLTWESIDPDGGAVNYDVYFGTVNPPPYLANRAARSFTPAYTMDANKIYYWRIRARDNELQTTMGPVWRFTTTPVANPPLVPYSPLPADGVGGQPSSVILTWECSDPDGPTLYYDVYFGTSANPPLVAQGRTARSYTVTASGELLRYYWRIVARDTDGFAVQSPVWSFVTASTGPPPGTASIGLFSEPTGSVCTLDDDTPGQRSVYVIVRDTEALVGADFSVPKPTCFNATYLGFDSQYLTLGDPQTGVAVAFGTCHPTPILALTLNYLSLASTPGCCEFAVLASPASGALTVTDCAFNEYEAWSEPVMGVSSTGACPPCQRGGFIQVVAAEDTCAVGTSSRLVVEVMVSPGAEGVMGGAIDVEFDPSSVTFVGCERGPLAQDWDALDCAESAGKVTITAAADAGHDPAQAGVLARLVFESHCCTWNAPLALALSGATGDLAALEAIDGSVTCRFGADGDINGDDAVTVADAQCALQAYLYAPALPPGGCVGPGGAARANVDCNSLVTPADAYCIFRHWLDQSCEFCGGGALAVASAPSRDTASRVGLRAIVEGNEVVIAVRAEGLAAAAAFGFELEYPREMDFAGVDPAFAARYGAVQAYVREPGRVRIGAYAAGDAVPLDGHDLVAVRLRANGTANGVVAARAFVDDLAGAPEAAVSLDGGAAVPAAHGVVLHQNSPNPFNPSTSIRFELPDAARVRLAVYGVDGSLVRVLLDGRRDAGETTVPWDGTDEAGRVVATGIYFCVLEAGNERLQRKMVLLK